MRGFRVSLVRLVVIGITVVATALLAVPPASAAASGGYWLLSGDGGVFSFHAPFYGSAASTPSRCAPNLTDRFLPNGTCFSIAATANGQGYYILNGDRGTVFTFGSAAPFGNPGSAFTHVSREFWPSFRQIVATRTGNGYWVLEVNLSNAATIATFGDAKNFGDSQKIVSKNHIAFAGTPVAMAPTPDNKGYWEVHSDGGVLAFGDAPFWGSMGGKKLAAPVVGIAVPPDGTGYWLVAANGQVFNFGHATPAKLSVVPAQPIVGAVANQNGAGFWMVARDGGVFAMAGAPFFGSMGGKHLNKPVFAITGQFAPPA